MGRPAVSVVIPAYNAAEFLEECLDSVSRQSFRDFEAIVVDDGSTDTTADIALRKASADGRFRLHRLYENRGVSGARNVGTALAEASRLCYLDADDCLHPQALELMTGCMESEKVGICRSAFSSRKGLLAKRFDRITTETLGFSEAMRKALYQKVLLNSVWAMVIDKPLVEEAGLFTEGIWYEDLDVFYRFMENAEKIAYIRQPLYYYRPNPKSFIRNWSDRRLDVLDVTDRMVEYFRKRYPELLNAALDRRFSAHCNMLLAMRRNGVDNPAAMDRCRTVIREGRLRALKDPDVRMKNKLGALMSYLII